MKTRDTVIAALQKYVAETHIIAEDGRFYTDCDGKPTVLYVAEALIALKSLYRS